MNKNKIISIVGAILLLPALGSSQTLTLQQCKELTLQNNAAIEEANLNIKKDSLIFLEYKVLNQCLSIWNSH